MAIGDAGEAITRRSRAIARTSAALSLAERLRRYRRCAEAFATSLSSGRSSAVASPQAIATACREAVDLRLRWLATSIQEELGQRTFIRAGDRARGVWHRLGPLLRRLGLPKEEHRAVAADLAALDALVCAREPMAEIDLAAFEDCLGRLLDALEASVALVETASGSRSD